MAFQKGQGGRPRGVPNKATASVKAAMAEAFKGLGGVPALIAWGKKNRTEFYKLYGRLIPHEVSGPEGGPIPIQPVDVFTPRA